MLCSPDGAVMQSVGDWLESIGLPQYENTLVANGFDDMDFMVRQCWQDNNSKGHISVDI